MGEYTDQAGNQKHIRFGKISDELYHKLVTFPGVKSVVLHKYGKKGEHPHWHIWWEGEQAITNQAWRNRWNKHIEPLPKFSGNGDWSFRNHNSWENWTKYTTKNLSHEVLLGYKDIKEISDQAKLLTLATPATPIIPGPVRVIKVQSRMRWDERICHDLETRLGWKRDAQFSLASLEDNTIDVHGQIERQVFAFMRGRLNNNEAVKYLRNVMYEFGDEDVKDYLVRKVMDKISWL